MTHSTHIARQLKEILSSRGLTATQLSRMAEVRSSFIYDVLSGKSRHPSVVTLSKIAAALAIPVSDLAGVEHKTLSNAPGKLAQSYVTIPPLQESDIPGSSAASPLVDITPLDQFVFRRSWIRSKLGVQPEMLRLLLISGDSMEPTLHHGDIVLVDTASTLPSPPGIFVIHDGVGVAPKRLEHSASSQASEVTVRSDNPRYSPYQRPLAELVILGRVVWFSRQL